MFAELSALPPSQALSLQSSQGSPGPLLSPSCPFLRRGFGNKKVKQRARVTQPTRPEPEFRSARPRPEPVRLRAHRAGVGLLPLPVGRVSGAQSRLFVFEVSLSPVPSLRPKFRCCNLPAWENARDKARAGARAPESQRRAGLSPPGLGEGATRLRFQSLRAPGVSPRARQPGAPLGTKSVTRGNGTQKING